MTSMRCIKLTGLALARDMINKIYDYSRFKHVTLPPMLVGVLDSNMATIHQEFKLREHQEAVLAKERIPNTFKPRMYGAHWTHEDLHAAWVMQTLGDSVLMEVATCSIKHFMSCMVPRKHIWPYMVEEYSGATDPWRLKHTDVALYDHYVDRFGIEKSGGIAQPEEQRSPKPQGAGSNPSALASGGERAPHTPVEQPRPDGAGFCPHEP